MMKRIQSQTPIVLRAEAMRAIHGVCGQAGHLFVPQHVPIVVQLGKGEVAPYKSFDCGDESPAQNYELAIRDGYATCGLKVLIRCMIGPGPHGIALRIQAYKKRVFKGSIWHKTTAH
jgi:hypothetical protein